MVKVKRALISCYDKSGLDRLAELLTGLQVEVVASGGTAAYLKERGARVKTVEEFAGQAAALDGRVKTLHPAIHAGILARRDEPSHLDAVGSGGLIDLVVVNLYPFEQAIRQPGIRMEEALEQIDIGGVALLRAAAKNWTAVAAVCHPGQYPMVAEALRREHGAVPQHLARQLAVEAFRRTSAYDTQIARFLDAMAQEDREAAEAGPTEPLPEVATVSVRKRQDLRYGENPHQRAGWYVVENGEDWGLSTLRQLQGKPLSYNNLLDVDAAVRCLVDYRQPTCVLIKHRMPCGLSCAASGALAYERAFASDPEAAFGGVVGINQALDGALARRLAATFLEVIVAPTVEPDALEPLKGKTNLRVVTVTLPLALPDDPEWRQLLGGSWLLQQPNALTLTSDTLRVVTTRSPTDAERRDLMFAWTAVKHAASNGIVIAHEQATVGIGQGQPSRVGSVRLAVEKAGRRARGAVAASDGFFPFPDGIELLAQAGVSAVIQPGGSIRDDEVIKAADAHGVAMLVTVVRHFRH
jgi:phosphoribosylaminoimidazolecarboxamide formyltransferase/IMP cyclohydrolase